jgi:hypothetical protein
MGIGRFRTDTIRATLFGTFFHLLDNGFAAREDLIAQVGRSSMASKCEDAQLARVWLSWECPGRPVRQATLACVFPAEHPAKLTANEQAVAHSGY